METNNNIELVKDFISSYKRFKEEISKVIIGQDNVVDQVLMSIFCDGHSLLVGVPGLAKTLLIQTISDCLGLKFNRIQFTPDLMPSDIVGSEILDNNRSFKFLKGPIFSNIILADEINRTPPKTQAALLEAMQEKSITNSGNTYQLDKPFFVLATQNPIEQEGTYPLPEAQLDRFMFNIKLDYPKYDEEIEIVKRTTSENKISLDKIMDSSDIIKYQNLIRSVPINDNVLHYAVSLVNKTRPSKENKDLTVNEYIEWGAGPRASQYIVLASKCHALLSGKYTPDIEDVKSISIPVLRHRIVKNYKAESKGMSVDDIIHKIL
jgi:MoxR-like ATPase